MDARAHMTSDMYRIRCLLGLIASLALLIALVHLPIRESPRRVGWTAHSSAERITLREVASESATSTTNQGPDDAPPPTAAQRVTADSRNVSSTQGPSENESGPSDSKTDKEKKDSQMARALSVSDQDPQIRGGMGSLYLNIHYPEQARAQGIEGRVILEFTVKSDGNVEHLDVAESLHPLCDSAAVKGVRSVDFIPAKHNGDPIPVRLRLPVRFKLAGATTAARAGTPGS